MKLIRGKAFIGLIAALSWPALLRGQFSYTTNTGTITITGYSGPGGAVTIPSNINGYPVTTIGNSAFYSKVGINAVTIPSSVISIAGLAFYWCSGLTNLDIPNSVTNIGVGAFSVCTNLTNITIPNNVTSIGSQCFSECTSATNITIPASLTNIGNAAFAHNPSLATIAVDPLNPNYTNIGGVLLDVAQSTLIADPANNPGTSYSVPGTVTKIGDFAFEYCNSLTNVMLPA